MEGALQYRKTHFLINQGTSQTLWANDPAAEHADWRIGDCDVL